MHCQHDVDFISGHDKPGHARADVGSLDGDRAHTFGDERWQTTTDTGFSESAAEQEFTASQVIAGGASHGIFDFAYSTFGDGVRGESADLQMQRLDHCPPRQVCG